MLLVTAEVGNYNITPRQTAKESYTNILDLD